MSADCAFRGYRLFGAVAVLVAGSLLGPACALNPDPVTGKDWATLSGAINADAAIPINRRTVHAVNTATGRQYSVRTNNVGGYTLLVPPGTYRLELPLRRGEALTAQPAPVEIERGGIAADLDFALVRRNHSVS